MAKSRRLILTKQINDYGTCYSSLSFLLSFTPYLKISFSPNTINFCAPPVSELTTNILEMQTYLISPSLNLWCINSSGFPKFGHQTLPSVVIPDFHKLSSLYSAPSFLSLRRFSSNSERKWWSVGFPVSASCSCTLISFPTGSTNEMFLYSRLIF